MIIPLDSDLKKNGATCVATTNYRLGPFGQFHSTLGRACMGCVTGFITGAWAMEPFNQSYTIHIKPHTRKQLQTTDPSLPTLEEWYRSTQQTRPFRRLATLALPRNPRNHSTLQRKPNQNCSSHSLSSSVADYTTIIQYRQRKSIAFTNFFK